MNRITNEQREAIVRKAVAERDAVFTGAPQKLWLWKNFVDGKPEYWAFDNPFPIRLDNGDPQTLGEPCGYAIFKPSRQGRTDVSEEQVLRAIARAAAASSPAATPTKAAGDVLAERERIFAALRAYADNEYCQGIRMAGWHAPCLGWESKIKAGKFGRVEHEAHEKMNKHFGAHFGIYEAIKRAAAEIERLDRAAGEKQS